MSKINSILIFPQKSEEKNKYMDDMGPASVYFAKLMRSLEDGLSCFNDPFEKCETWIILENDSGKPIWYTMS